MAQTRTYTRSFAGGEVSPEMWGRIDDVKFQTGAAKLQNFIALPQGPAENRPGTAFVREVKDSTKRTRLIPFTFSTTQTMVLEMGAGYFRFHTQGATIGPGTPAAYSTTKTISAVNTGTETFTSNTHGYANGTPVQVSATTTLPAPLVAATTYYVINAAANTYQLSLTATGSAIDITTAGSGTITTNQVYSVGNLVSSGGVNYYCIASTAGNTPPNATYWYAMPAGIYEIPNPYAEADLFDIHYVQSADVLTLVHPGYAPRELRRLGATTWTLTTISFASTVTSPTGVSVTANRGEALDLIGFTTANPGVAHAVAPHGLAVGDPVYLDGGTWTNPFPDDYYIVSGISAGDKFRVRSYSSGIELDTTSYGTWSSGGYVQFGDKSLDFTSYYVVTTIAPNGIDESEPSSAASANNNLNAAGSSNTITWSSVTGAARYNIYKRQNGLYGLIGQTDLTTFTDNNIGPDMGITPPIIDTVFASAGNYPGAVSYFEQRRVFAGTTNAPQTMWMTRTGTESDISYHIPIQDTDRIAFRVAAREANTIRHIVPLTQLLALTSAAEWRISPVNSDTITPTTISVRPQSYVGANNVQPSIVNNTVVYCSARDGHVRELGYSWQASGFVTGDLSLRSTHLFDNYDIIDMCYSKAPQPLLWFISSTGSMLGLTYIPEQQVGAWHQHVTDGSYESCAAVAEGAEDRLYVVVKRTIGGVTKRYVERFASRQVTTIENCFFVDCGLTYDGTNTTATTVTVTGSTYLPSDTLTITASSAIFQFPSTSTPPTDINDAIVMTDSDGNKYRLRIIGTTSTTVATARVDVTLPAALRNTATTVWAFARDTISGLSHLEGKTVSILADGAVMPQVVVASGQVTLQRASVLVHVGLPYESDLETLPMALQMEAFGQGRAKNVNEAFLRVYRSSGIFVGPDNDNLTEAKQRTTEPYGSPPGLKTDEIGVKLTPTWRQSGRIYVRQADPLPLTIVGLTLEVAIGG
jgi:hypothetical protein